MANTTDKKFACNQPECGKSFGSKGHLDRHVKDVHGPPFVCPECGKSIRGKDNFNTHTKRHEGKLPKPYKCEHCPKTFERPSDLEKHMNANHRAPIPCPEQGCHVSCKGEKALEEHRRIVHEGEARKVFKCDQCPKATHSRSGLSRHVDAKHRPPIPCTVDGCKEECQGREALQNHIRIKHDGPPVQKNHECAECGMKHRNPSDLAYHIDCVHDPPYECSECGKLVRGKFNLNRHIRIDHEGKPPMQHECEECGKMWGSPSALKKHFESMHAVVVCPVTGCNVESIGKAAHKAHRKADHPEMFVRSHDCDECGKPFEYPGRLAKHITFDHGHPTIPCPVQGCSRLFSRSENAQKHFDDDHCENVFECHYVECNTKCISKQLLKDHVDADHLGMRFPCKYSVEFGCKKEFLSRSKSRLHSDRHYPEVCQIPRCLAHMQGRRMTTCNSAKHYQRHVELGQCQDGEYLPKILEIPEVSDDDEENAAEEVAEQPAIEETELDQDDLEDDDDYPQEPPAIVDLGELVSGEIPTGLALMNILEVCRKDQETLRKALASQIPKYRDLNLKCPGPGIVLENLVQGTDTCPAEATVTSEDGILYSDRTRRLIGVKIRCLECQMQHSYDLALANYCIKAKPDQKVCGIENCFDVLFRRTQLCQYHFSQWIPGRLGEAGMEKARALFIEAASVQWKAEEGSVMAKILNEENADGSFDSQLLTIDLEFSTRTHQVYQIGICGRGGEKKLDCFTDYSEEAIKNLPSSALYRPMFQGQTPVKLARWEAIMSKGRGVPTDGTLRVQEVGDRLDSMLSKPTTFVTWGAWAFDVAHVRSWLDGDNVAHKLPQNDKVLLLYQEYAKCLNGILGRDCYYGSQFPLSLELTFRLLFAGHELEGKNHNALVDARQTDLLLELLIDLCKPKHKRVMFKGELPITIPGSTPSIRTHFPSKTPDSPEDPANPEDPATPKTAKTAATPKTAKTAARPKTPKRPTKKLGKRESLSRQQTMNRSIKDFFPPQRQKRSIDMDEQQPSCKRNCLE